MKTFEEIANDKASLFYNGTETIKSDIVNACIEAIKESHEWISVADETPDKRVLLAKSPSGCVHLCHYRHAYDIFTVQCKTENTKGWTYKYIDIVV